MSQLADFLHDLLHQGTITFWQPPDFAPDHGPESVGVLREAYEFYRLEVAGPLIDFDAAAALAAGDLVRRAAWYLLNRDEPEAEVERALHPGQPPVRAAQHLSADLVLRFLPTIHRRARLLAPGDRLPDLLAEVLRRWPLTGVLSDVDEEPLTSLDLDGHPGLLLLYAERLGRKLKPAWVPSQGPVWEYVELILGDRIPVGPDRPS
jgi:hypothetical protein